MRIRGGHTIEVYRNTTGKDRHGDPVADQPELIGTIDNVVFQWASAASVGLRFHSSKGFQETSDLSAVVFAPRDAEILLQARDRIKFNGETYQVVGNRAWDENHPVTGRDYGFYMMQIDTAT